MHSYPQYLGRLSVNTDAVDRLPTLDLVGGPVATLFRLVSSGSGLVWSGLPLPGRGGWRQQGVRAWVRPSCLRQSELNVLVPLNKLQFIRGGGDRDKVRTKA